MESNEIAYQSIANSAAFPFSFEYENEVGPYGIPAISRRTSFGITRREYFTAIAIQGILSGLAPVLIDKASSGMFDAIVGDAINIADIAIEKLYPLQIDENKTNE